ncbi:MAG: hypothetical protein H0X67_14545 [Acidobacteria bacterium]|nr:hypothetical protein [Acidobacteriota bacterium]
MHTVLSLPKLLFPLAVLLPFMAMAALVAVPETLTPLSYGLFAVFVCALPTLALLSARNTQPALTVARARHTGDVRARLAPPPVRHAMPPVRRGA